MPSQPPRRFPLLQALRAVAAFSVALTHILYQALGMVPASKPVRALYDFMPWGAGVDIFFVISGFVIVHSSRRLFGTAGAARNFAARRLARIVPLYWLMTSLLLVATIYFPNSVNAAIGGPVFVLKSYLFIPCARPDGSVQPVLSLGWTLNYEMFFYFVFIPFLYLREVQAVKLATIVLALFVLAGRNGLFAGVILQTWSNPIILEFCAGMLLALLLGTFFLNTALRMSIVILALTWLHLMPDVNRVIAYGIPATLLVFAAIIGKPATGMPKLEVWLVRLGDASYALYLVHPFVMRAASLLWRHAHGPAIYAYILVTLTVSQLAALAIHYYFERPVRRIALKLA